jgi:3-hydroxyisobutyrate dehydrogenase-like beta-hydroxyacid dehydrogenase
MGLPICLHIQAAGIDVAGWDSDSTTRAAAAERGVPIPDSLPEALREASCALFLVGSEMSMHAVLRDAFGLMPPGSVQLVMGTISPELAERIADEGRRMNQHVINAPLCRTVAGAQEANSLALVSGNREVAERVRPVLEAFCSDIVHIGERPGDAQAAKAVNNLMLWASVMANEEGFKLASAYGLDLETLRRSLVISTADSWSLREWRHAAEWPWSMKDLHLIGQMAARRGVEAPLADELSRLVTRSQVLTHAPDNDTPADAQGEVR